MFVRHQSIKSSSPEGWGWGGGPFDWQRKRFFICKSENSLGLGQVYFINFSFLCLYEGQQAWFVFCVFAECLKQVNNRLRQNRK